MCTALQLTNFWQDLGARLARRAGSTCRWRGARAAGAGEATSTAGRLTPAWRAALALHGGADARAVRARAAPSATASAAGSRLRTAVDLARRQRGSSTGWSRRFRRVQPRGRRSGRRRPRRRIAVARRRAWRQASDRPMGGRDTSFYYSFLVLPAEKRRAIIAVWDFCRAVDDAVDEMAPCGPEERRRRRTARARARRDGGASSRCFAAGDPRRRRARHLQPFIVAVRPAARRVRGRHRRRRDGPRPPPLRRPSTPARVLPARGVGGRAICVEIFGYRDPRAARLRRRPRHRAAAHEHPARRPGRPGARAASTCRSRISRASAAPRTTCAPACVTDRCARCSSVRVRAGPASYYARAEATLPRRRGAAPGGRAHHGRRSTSTCCERIERATTTCSPGRQSACRGPRARGIAVVHLGMTHAGLGSLGGRRYCGVGR